MGFRDLLDDAVRAEEAELARDAGGRGAGVLGPWRAGGGGEGRVAKAGDRKLAAADSGEKRHVVGITDAQGADTAPAVGDRPGHLVEEVPQGVRSSTAARASS